MRTDVLAHFLTINHPINHLFPNIANKNEKTVIIKKQNVPEDRKAKKNNISTYNGPKYNVCHNTCNAGKQVVHCY